MRLPVASWRRRQKFTRAVPSAPAPVSIPHSTTTTTTLTATTRVSIILAVPTSTTTSSASTSPKPAAPSAPVVPLQHPSPDTHSSTPPTTCTPASTSPSTSAIAAAPHPSSSLSTLMNSSADAHIHILDPGSGSSSNSNSNSIPTDEVHYAHEHIHDSLTHESEDIAQRSPISSNKMNQKQKRIILNPPEAFLVAAAEQKALSAQPDSVNSPVVIGQGGQAAMVGSSSTSSSGSGSSSGTGSTSQLGSQGQSQSQAQGQGQALSTGTDQSSDTTGLTGSTSDSTSNSNTAQGQAQQPQQISLAVAPDHTQAVVVAAATAATATATATATGVATGQVGGSTAVAAGTQSPGTETAATGAVTSSSRVTSTSASATLVVSSNTASSTSASASASSSTSIASTVSSTSSSSSSIFTSTAPSASTSSSSSSSTSEPFTKSPVFIVLVVLASLAAVALIATLISCLLRRRRRGSTSAPPGWSGFGGLGGLGGLGYGNRDHDDGLSDLVQSFERGGMSRASSYRHAGMTQVHIDDAEAALHRRSGLFASDPSSSPFLHSGTADLAPPPHTTTSVGFGAGSNPYIDSLPPILPAVTVQPATLSPFDAAHGYGTPPPPGHGFQAAHLYGVPGPLEVKNASPSEMGVMGMSREEENEHGTPRQDEASKSPRYMGVDGTGLDVPWSRPAVYTPSSYLSPDADYAGPPFPSPPVTDHPDHPDHPDRASTIGVDTGADATGTSWATNLRNSLFAAINGAKTPGSTSIMGDALQDRFTRTVLPLHRGSTRRAGRQLVDAGVVDDSSGSERGTFGARGRSKARIPVPSYLGNSAIGSEITLEKGIVHMSSRPGSEDGTVSSFTPPEMSRASSRESRVSMPTPVVRARGRLPLRGARAYKYTDPYSGRPYESSVASSEVADWEEGGGEGDGDRAGEGDGEGEEGEVDDKRHRRLAGGTRALGVHQ